MKNTIVTLLHLCAGVAAFAACSSSQPEEAHEARTGSAKGPNPPTEIVFAVDARSLNYLLQNLTAEVRIDGAIASVEHADLALTHETRVVAPIDKTGANVEITVTATIQEGAVTFRRTARTHFREGKRLLAYFAIDPECAVPAGSLAHGCTNAGETCRKTWVGWSPLSPAVGPVPSYWASGCNSDALSENLPDYRADWRDSPPLPEEHGPPCGDGSVGSIALTHTDTNTPILDNDLVSLECGGQGGHHMPLNFSLRNLWPLNTTMVFSASLDGVPAITQTASIVSFAECVLHNPILLQLDPHCNSETNGGGCTGIETTFGKPLDLQVDVTDMFGHTASLSRHIIIASTLNCR